MSSICTEKRAVEIILTVDLFLSQKRVGKIYFSSDLFFLVMVRYILIFKIYLFQFTFRTLLNELVTVERINEKFT